MPRHIEELHIAHGDGEAARRIHAQVPCAAERMTQIAVHDPKLIRMEQRVNAELFSLHGVELAPISRTIEIGRKLAEYRAGITAKAFEASKQRLRDK